MEFNADKCKVMYFKAHQSRLNPAETAFSVFHDCQPPLDHYEYKLPLPNGSEFTLDMFSCERDLGIMINDRLNWKNQVDHAVSKASSALGTIKRTFRFWNKQSCNTLYKTTSSFDLILSIVHQFGIPVQPLRLKD